MPVNRRVIGLGRPIAMSAIPISLLIPFLGGGGNLSLEVLGVVIATAALITAIIIGIYEHKILSENEKLTMRISEYQSDEKTAVLWRHAKDVKAKMHGQEA